MRVVGECEPGGADTLTNGGHRSPSPAVTRFWPAMPGYAFGLPRRARNLFAVRPSLAVTRRGEALPAGDVTAVCQRLVRLDYGLGMNGRPVTIFPENGWPVPALAANGPPVEGPF